MQIDNAGPISIIVSTSSLNLPESSYTTVLGTTNSLTSAFSSTSSGVRCKRSLETTLKSESWYLSYFCFCVRENVSFLEFLLHKNDDLQRRQCGR